MTDMSLAIAGVALKNPVIAASGVFGYGREYEPFYPLSRLGGIATKGTTAEPRTGNPPPRIAESPQGVLNSVGLQNPGVDAFVRDELPNLLTKDTVILANIAGSTIEEYVQVAQKFEKTDVHMMELNISCPNVQQGGAMFGVHCESAAEVTRAVRNATKKPLVVKLSPNVADIAEVAKAVESAGADAISLINTLLGMRIDLETRRPILKNNVGGLSGPAIFPVALRMVWQVKNAVSIPVLGIGGITTGKDAVEMMLAGACAVQVGSAILADPFAPVRILDEMISWMEEHGVKAAEDLVGAVVPW